MKDLKQYYILFNSQQSGPYTIEQIENLNLPQEAMVWTDGMPDWQPIHNLLQVHKPSLSFFKRNPALAWITLIISVIIIVWLIFLPILRKEDQIWNAAVQENTIRSYNYYLNEYPNGKYARHALKNMKRISKETGKERWKNRPGANN